MDEFNNNEHIDTDDIKDSANKNSLNEDRVIEDKSKKQNPLVEKFGRSKNGKEQNSLVEENEPPKKSAKREVLDWIISIVAALAIAFLVREYVFTIVRVDGPSMQPTLEDSDILFVNRFFYEPKNGDIIIFHPITNSEVAYVKRVIAVEGQEVNIDPREGTVYVDGVELKEDYIKAPLKSAGKQNKYPMVVPADHVFVLGDNRNNSTDSRDLGPVSHESIMGKVIFRILPFDEFGSVYN